MENSFFSGIFSFLSFIHVTSSWQATITMILQPIWKKMSNSFSTPNFFSNKPILYQQQLTDPGNRIPEFPRHSRRRHNKCVGRVTSPRLRAPETRGKPKKQKLQPATAEPTEVVYTRLLYHFFFFQIAI